jgi:outer membrane lipoprotein SlyB
MSLYVIWGVLLIVQNAAFTWVSRARNSGSVGYHAIASVFSNGVWFACQLILIASITDAAKRGTWAEAIGLGAFYTACTVIGSVAMHIVSLRYLERGKRKVGA